LQQEAIVNETDVGPALESYCNVRLGRGMHVLYVEEKLIEVPKDDEAHEERKETQGIIVETKMKS